MNKPGLPVIRQTECYKAGYLSTIPAFRGLCR